MNAWLGPALRTAALGAALLALLTLWGGRWWALQAQLVQLVRPQAAATASLFGDGFATPGTPIGQPQRLLIRIPFVSPTMRNFAGLLAPRPEPVFLLLCGAALRVAFARTHRALQPIQSESVGSTDPHSVR